jgi:hypothetical protein
MSAIEPKKHLISLTQRMKGLLVNDLNAIPADKQNVCPGGCARPPLSLVVECGMINEFIAKFLTTGSTERMPREQREAFMNSFDTSEKALDYLDNQTQTLCAAFETLDENSLGETSDVLFGRPMTRLAIAELPAFHMMYHDGQLNYIQTLYGDTEIHW